MIAIVADSECNGLPKNYKVDWRTPDNWPRATQLAWMIVDTETGQTLVERDFIIFPDLWFLPSVEELTAQGNKNPYFFEENNISTQRCIDEGVPIHIVLKTFCEDILTLGVQVMVFHNLNFDFNVIAAEMSRYGASLGRQIPKICTMMSTVEFCALPGAYGLKWPKLAELHQKIFGCDFEGQHDALFDVRATAKCFVTLVKQGFYDQELRDILEEEFKNTQSDLG